MSVSPIRPTSPTSPRPEVKPATTSPQKERSSSPTPDLEVLASHIHVVTPEYIKKHPSPYWDLPRGCVWASY